MIDVHCHLNFHSFGKDYDEVIKKAFQDGVTKIINVGTKIDSSQKAVELAQKYDNLYAIIGVHPHHADKPFTFPGKVKGKPEVNWSEELEKLASKPKVVGIGECGMDYFSYRTNDIVDPKLQKEVFIKQIELAHKLNLPLQIHNRQATKDTIEILNSHKSLLKRDVPGMFHCFAGNMNFLKKALELGFYIGFDGNITYEGLAPGEDTDLKDLAKYTPIDRIVAETDSPFLTPKPFRGRRNIPSYVIIVGEFLSQLKHLSFDQIKEQTINNSNKIFKL